MSLLSFSCLYVSLFIFIALHLDVLFVKESRSDELLSLLAKVFQCSIAGDSLGEFLVAGNFYVCVFLYQDNSIVEVAFKK